MARKFQDLDGFKQDDRESALRRNYMDEGVDTPQKSE